MQARNEDIAAAATFHHKCFVFTLAALAAATTKRVGKIKVPHDIEILSVDTNTSAIAGGVPTVDVLVGATSALAAPINLANDAHVAGALHATKTRQRVAKNASLVVNATTPGGVTITDLTVSVWYRAIGTRGGQK